jgi:hypothetical protein
MPDTCILCQLNAPIQNSHIVPNFVVKRLKNGSPLKTLVHSNVLNQVFQDGWKGPYLCKSCEADFSALEGWFCNAVYDPFLKNGSVQTSYDSTLALFAASIAFRYLALLKDRRAENPNWPTGLENIYSGLRAALLAKNESQVPFSSCIQFLFPVTEVGPLPPGINTYFFEAIDAKAFPFYLTNFRSKLETWMIFVKFPSIVFFFFDPKFKFAVNCGIAIEAAGTLNSNDSGPTNELIADDFCKRAVEIQTNYQRMPEQRLEKNLTKIKSSPDVESFRAHKSFVLDQTLMAKFAAAVKQ